jgi:hypothetical protein
MKLNACIRLLITFGQLLYTHIQIDDTDWRKSPFLLPLLILFRFPFQSPFTYLESLPLCGAIPSTLAPGCS